MCLTVLCTSLSNNTQSSLAFTSQSVTVYTVILVTCTKHNLLATCFADVTNTLEMMKYLG